MGSNQNRIRIQGKSAGDLTDAEVRHRVRPDHLGVVALIVLGHLCAGMPSDLLSLPAGPLVQRQRPDLLEAWHFLLAPSLVAARGVLRVLKSSGQESLFDRRPVVLRLGLLLLEPLRLPVDQVRQ